jgi:mannose-6-phosphate isomerase-like protein (cupin superfamily)
MNQFVLQQGRSTELRLFPHIREVGIRKNGSIQLNTFPITAAEDIRIYYIVEGKFEWCVNHQVHICYPGDVVLILPGQPFGSDNGVLEIGTFTWIDIGI